MKGQVIQQTKQEEVEIQEEPTQTILEANGLILEPINEEDKKIILKELGEIKDKFYKAWRVTNKATKERFENEISQANNKTTRLLWHGSKNENWFSIMSNGLLLNPNAAITGKMFRVWIVLSGYKPENHLIIQVIKIHTGRTEIQIEHLWGCIMFIMGNLIW